MLYVFGAFLLFTGVRSSSATTRPRSTPSSSPVLQARAPRRAVDDRVRRPEAVHRRRTASGSRRRCSRCWCSSRPPTWSSPSTRSRPSSPSATSSSSSSRSNVFAILGLRALYFLLAGMHDRFRYLQQGLAVILAFVGVKMIARTGSTSRRGSRWSSSSWCSGVDRSPRCRSERDEPAATARCTEPPTGAIACRPASHRAGSPATMAIVDEDIERVRPRSTSSTSFSSTSQLRQGRAHAGSGCARSTPRRRRRSRQRRGPACYHCFGCDAAGDVITLRARDRAPRLRRRRRVAGRARPASRSGTRRAARARSAARRKRLVEAMAQAVEWYHERLLHAPDAGRRADYLRCAGIDGDVVAPVPARLGARRLGRAVRGAAAARRRAARHRPRLPQPARPPAGLVPGAGDVPDLRRAAATRSRSAGASCPGARRAEVQELAGDADLRQVASALRAELGQGRRSSHADEVDRLRGLHRRHRLRQRGRAAGGRHLRHRAHRGARPAAQALRPSRVVLAFDADAAGQAAAERFYEWERKLRARRGGRRAARRRRPGRPGPAPIPARCRPRSTDAMPFLGFRVDRVLDAADLVDTGGPGARRRGRARVIREHPSELVRDQYLMQVADRCRHRPRSPAGRLSRARDRHGVEPTDAGARGEASRDRGGRLPDSSVDASLGRDRTAVLSEVLFSDVRHPRRISCTRGHCTRAGCDRDRDAGGCRSAAPPRSRKQIRLQRSTPSVADRAARSAKRRNADSRRFSRDRADRPTSRERSPAHRRGPRAQCAIGSGRAVASLARRVRSEER